MNSKIYNKILRETKKNKSDFVFHRDENIASIKGDLFLEVLENLPPHLQQSKALVRLKSLYSISRLSRYPYE